MALWKERSQPLHLLVRQPEQIAHDHPRSSGALNHAAAAASSKSMGPDPRFVDANSSLLIFTQNCAVLGENQQWVLLM